MYTVDYFIKKFEAIPEDKWCTGDLEDKSGACCALGHLGVREYTEDQKSFALGELFKKHFDIPAKIHYHEVIYTINDGLKGWGNIHFNTLGETPKARILAALRDIKAMQEKENKPERVKTVYVSVPETIKEQTLELILS